MPPETLDDEDGNCKQCGHPFEPHIIAAYDIGDFSKGGEDAVSRRALPVFLNRQFRSETGVAQGCFEVGNDDMRRSGDALK